MLRLTLSIIVLAFASGVLADPGKDESGKWHEYRHVEQPFYFWLFEDSDRHNHSHRPKGHRPPPGECRVWYDDLPPGQQPPPYKC